MSKKKSRGFRGKEAPMTLKQRRIAMMVSGIFLMGFSVAIFRKSLFGVDPFSTMNLGISNVTGLSFGTLQVLVNIVIFVIMFRLTRDLIGIGTVINMIGVGYIVDFFTPILGKILPETLSLLDRSILMVVGILLITLAASFYFTADLGLAPYDCVSFAIERKWKVPFQYGRIVTDILCVVVGFLTGSVVGLGTLFAAVGTGPFVNFFNKKVSVPFLENGKK